MFFLLGLLLLVAATTTGGSRARTQVAVVIAASKLFLHVWAGGSVDARGSSFWLFMPDEGRLCLLWVMLHPNILIPPVAQPLLQRYALSFFFLWVALAWVVVPVWIVSITEAAVLVVALAWRAFVLVLQIRATPPLAFVTPLLGSIMPMFHYDENEFYTADGVSPEVVDARRRSLAQLAKRWGRAGSREGESTNAPDRLRVVRKYIADYRFTNTTSAFFPFQKHIASVLDPSFILDRVTEDNHIIDVDGTKLWDADCSFGVNVIGYGHYKRFLARGFEAAKDHSVCLGKLTPQVERNASRICSIANKEQCSFHMSGTEAVMGAVRLARFNTNRPLVCVFSGAYHGWYDGVMQIGTTRPVDDLLVLKFGSEASLDLLRARGAEIAAVLVNPLCALDVNKPPPADFSLLSNVRGKAPPDVQAYGSWLRKLVATCRDCGIVSIFDEVYVGFRYARGGAQEFFNVDCDVVCYGKTLGGGLPCGVICGPAKFLKRSGEESPLKKAVVIGTFSSHPVVMATMDEFLTWSGEGNALAKQACAEKYTRVNNLADAWVARSNAAFVAAKDDCGEIPMRIVNVGSIWGLRFTAPGRYHWMLQYFLLDEGIKLASIGSGRMNLRLDTTDEELNALTDKLLRAAARMREGGWWTQQATVKTTPQIFQMLFADAMRTWARRAFAAVQSIVAATLGAGAQDKNKGI